MKRRIHAPNFSGAYIHRLLISITILIGTYSVFRPFALKGIDTLHDGTMLKPALDVLHGQVLFRDTFIQYGALTTYLQALSLKLFGASLKTLKLSTLGMYAASSVVFYQFWRLFLPISLAIFSWVLWVIMAPFYEIYAPFWPWSSAYALFFQGLCLYFLVKVIQSERKEVFASLCGVACGLTFLSRQPVGVFTMGAGLLGLGVQCLWIENRKKNIQNLLFYLLGFGIVVLTFLGALLMGHAYEAWYTQTVLWPREWVDFSVGITPLNILGALIRGYRSGLTLLLWMMGVLGPFFLIPHTILAKRSRLKFLFLAGYYIFLFVLYFVFEAYESDDTIFPRAWSFAIPFTVLIHALFQLLLWIRSSKSPEKKEFALFTVSLLCLASWLQYFPMNCPRHIFWGVTPSIGIFIFILYRLSGQRVWAVICIVGIFFIPSARETFHLAQEKLSQNYTTLQSHPILEGMQVLQESAEEWENLGKVLSTYFEKHPNVPIVVDGTNLFFTAFAINLRNSSPYFEIRDTYRYEDRKKRSEFIAKFHPLIFNQNYTRPSEYFREYHAHYRSIFKSRSGEFLAVEE